MKIRNHDSHSQTDRGTDSKQVLSPSRGLAIAILVSICATLCGGGQAQAGTTFQGTTFQGTTFQGTTFQGTTFQGTTFQGTELHAAAQGSWWLEGSSHPGDALEIRSFRGAFVELVVGGEQSGRSRLLTVHASELVGLRWTEALHTPSECRRIHKRIAAAAPDASNNTMPGHRDNSDIWLFRVEYADSLDGPWSGVCDRESNDSELGLFVDGQWNRDGSWRPEGHTFSCQRGVVAKCARGWGYKPWKSLTAADGTEVDLRPLHQACTRAARADYAGDGVSHTRDGVLVDMFDIHGFNVAEYVEDFVEEARFDRHGAVSVHHSRLVDSDFDVAGFVADPPRQGGAIVHVWSRTDTRR